MTEDDNLLLEHFFQPARERQVADDGFSHRVMSHLPDKALRQSHQWTAFCMGMGFLLFVLLHGWESLRSAFGLFLHTLSTDVHPLSLLIALATLMILGTIELVQRITETANRHPMM